MRNIFTVLLLLGGAANILFSMVLSFYDQYDKATFSLVIGIWMLESLRRERDV